VMFVTRLHVGVDSGIVFYVGTPDYWRKISIALKTPFLGLAGVNERNRVHLDYRSGWKFFHIDTNKD